MHFPFFFTNTMSRHFLLQSFTYIQDLDAIPPLSTAGVGGVTVVRIWGLGQVTYHIIRIPFSEKRQGVIGSSEGDGCLGSGRGERVPFCFACSHPTPPSMEWLGPADRCSPVILVACMHGLGSSLLFRLFLVYIRLIIVVIDAYFERSGGHWQWMLDFEGDHLMQEKHW